MVFTNTMYPSIDRIITARTVKNSRMIPAKMIFARIFFRSNEEKPSCEAG